MKNMILMSSPSGSGKSTLAKKIKEKYETNNEVIWILSTDEYWGKGYEFDHKKLGEAHHWNQKRCKDFCELGRSVIIDNTNLTFREIQVYLDIAKEFGYFVSLVRPCNEWGGSSVGCFEKNVHNIPREVIDNQFNRVEANLEERIVRYMYESN